MSAEFEAINQKEWPTEGPMRRFLAVGLLLVLVAVVLKLVAAPLYAVYDAEDCQRAYARARTVRDSARVDLHPYATASGAPGRHRCGEVRTVRSVTASDISAPRELPR